MTNEERQTVIDALEAGRDAAAEVATRYHEAMAGYRKSEHERLDADVARIDAALAIMRREREPVARVSVYKTGGNAGLAWHALPTDDAPLMRDGELLYR